MDINHSIAGNLTGLRKREGISINTLAVRTGLSKAAISQIEQGKGNPTISTISKLAEALHVPYSALLAPVSEEAQVLFADDVPLDIDQDGKFRKYTYYGATPQRGFEVNVLEIESDCIHSIELEENTINYIILNKGIIIMETGDLSYFLMEGDAISFGGPGHCVLKNDSSEKAQATLIRQYISR